MKLRVSRYDAWTMRKVYKGKQKGVVYKITEDLRGGYYVLANDTKKDLRLNTLWFRKNFETLDEAREWCESNPNIEEIREYLKLISG